MTPDPLEQFVLHGPEREVDAWWYKHGMGSPGLVPVLWKMSTGEVSECGAPHYTTDRGLRWVIEDRVQEVQKETDEAVWVSFCEGIDDMRAKPDSAFVEAMGDGLKVCEWAIVENAINATNRQVLLAAAKAMGLQAPEEG
jgi:hypothetical protein